MIGDTGPTGLYDLLGEKPIPVFEGSLNGETVIEGHFGTKKVADDISIWLPGVLKVDPWPEVGMNQFEWYVPVDATTHCYLQALGRMTANKDEAAAFREVNDTWVELALDGFNDDDVWAREATEEFYGDNDRGWIEERLFETDMRSWSGGSSQASGTAASSVAKISEGNAMARYVVHQLIQNLFKEPGLLERLNSAPDAVYDVYRLTAAEREAVSEASPAALASIGVHPILQMHLMLARNPQMAEMISVKSYTAEWGIS